MKIVVILIMLFSCLVFVAEAQDDNLILLLSFEEVSGNKVMDGSGNGNDAQINGNPQLVQGKFGQAMSFDGTADWLAITSNDILNPEQITVMAWANPDAVTGCHRVFSKDDGSKRNYELSFCDGALEFAAWNQDGGRAIPNGTGVEASTWSHLAATFDGTTVKLYINGASIGELPLAGKLQNTDADLVIGRFSEGQELYSGLLDEIAIYNVALTDAEISDIMTSGTVSSVELKGKAVTTWSNVKSSY